MFQSNLWCYLWDLADEGVDEALDRIQSNLGASGISVATCYHSVVQLRPHEEVRPRVFRSGGGVWFQPEPSHYADTRLKPVAAGWLRSRNPLKQVGEKCRERGLTLNSWTVCCHSSMTVARFPEMACKNVFGDAEATWLCPANADVQAYLRGVAADLSHNYPIDTIELESPHWAGSMHVHEHEKTGPPLRGSVRELLSLCFCESCRQEAGKAGVDVEHVARGVADVLNGFLKTETPVDPIEELAGKHDDLAKFLEWRTRTIERLIGSIKKACQCRLLAYGTDRSPATGYDAGRVRSQVDALMGFAYSPEVSVVEAACKELQDLLGTRREAMAIGLNATHPSSPNAQAIVRTATRAAELGIRQANIYNYGLLTDERLTWVRQAIRSARRAAEG
jgi:hypothetical protein